MPWVARAVREPPLQGSVLRSASGWVDDVDYASLYGDLFGGQNEVLVVAILWFEPQEVPGFARFAVETLD
jgi:hypothetical protein